MIITRNLNRWMFLCGTLFCFLASIPIAAFEKSALETLSNARVWNLNIDGFEYKIRLYGHDQNTGPSGWLRRGIGNKHGKGLFHLKWRGRQAILDLTVPIVNGQQINCSGMPARDLSFASGKCDVLLPFVMTPQNDQSHSATQYETCKRSNQILKSNNAKARDMFKQCQRARNVAEQKLKTSVSAPHLNSSDIAQTASRNLPYSGGASCAKCDSAPKLDVPQDPKNNTAESRWLVDLLTAQNQTIGQLFGTSGQNQVKTQEGRVCEGKQKCFALFRQNVIAAAAQEIGKSQ